MKKSQGDITDRETLLTEIGTIGIETTIIRAIITIIKKEVNQILGIDKRRTNQLCKFLILIKIVKYQIGK